MPMTGQSWSTFRRAILAIICAAAMGVGVIFVIAANVNAFATKYVSISTVNLTLPQYVDDEGWLNLNSADIKSLSSLPGIGPVISQRIIDYRDLEGGFHDERELIRVKGIGDKTLAALVPLVFVDHDPDDTLTPASSSVNGP